MLKKIIKFFSITESYNNWESLEEYNRKTLPVIVIIVTIIVLVCYAIFH